MHCPLNKLFGIPTVQTPMDILDDFIKLPSAILDRDGNILTTTT